MLFLVLINKSDPITFLIKIHSAEFFSVLVSKWIDLPQMEYKLSLLYKHFLMNVILELCAIEIAGF